MAVWGDEVEAAVNPVVLDILAIQPALVFEVLFELTVYVVVDRLPAARDRTTPNQHADSKLERTGAFKDYPLPLQIWRQSLCSSFSCI